MKKMKELDDDELIECAREGAAEAFGELYERYARTIFSFIYERVEDQTHAEDLTEEVFLRAWDSMPRYDKQELGFSAFLLRIARNTLIHRKLCKKRFWG
jgi:RNA polymerase sigma-70 factor (ECF subfamily)